MHYILNHKWIVEVLLALPGVVLVLVSVLLGSSVASFLVEGLAKCTTEEKEMYM